MPVFKKILVPVDGSATSNKAVDFALRMAQDDLASVRLLHCIDETSFLDAYEYSSELIKQARQAGQKILHDTDRKFNRMRPSMARVLGLETRSAKEG